MHRVSRTTWDGSIPFISHLHARCAHLLFLQCLVTLWWTCISVLRATSQPRQRALLLDNLLYVSGTLIPILEVLFSVLSSSLRSSAATSPQLDLRLSPKAGCVCRSMLRTFFCSVRPHERSQTRRATDIDLALLLPIIGRANIGELNESCQEADQPSHPATVRPDYSHAAPGVLMRERFGESTGHDTA